jgi:hypothetical protein
MRIPFGWLTCGGGLGRRQPARRSDRDHRGVRDTHSGATASGGSFGPPFRKARRGRRADAAPRLDGNERKAEMITPMTSTDPLVKALATRLRLIDLVGWQRIATWAEQSELSFEDLRLLLALAFKMDDGPASVHELADLAGFPLDVASPPPTGSGVAVTSVRNAVDTRSTSRGKSSSPGWTRRTARASRHTSTSSIATNVSCSVRPSRSRDKSKTRRQLLPGRTLRACALERHWGHGAHFALPPGRACPDHCGQASWRPCCPGVHSVSKPPAIEPNSWKPPTPSPAPKVCVCRVFGGGYRPQQLLAMQKVVGSNPFSRFRKAPLMRGFLVSGDLELGVRPATLSQQLSRAAAGGQLNAGPN